MKLMKRLLLMMSFTVITLTSFSQEGMWLLNQIGQLDLQEKGLDIEMDQIYNSNEPALYRAIVQLGGGTASFVSPEGLLVTNHHVAYTAIQRASSVNSDYLTEGFLANTKQEEIQAPGYTARLLLEMKDVTNDIQKAAKGIDDPVEADEKINEKIRELTDKYEKEKEDITASVSEMFNGRQYMLFVYKQFKDIRIVYAPPSAIGKFGGDIDNWMWPRHTGDFSFMRVYVSPDGKGTEYNEENVPYRPEVWLRTSETDLDEGDFTFILGFPGFTTRYRTSNSASWNLNVNYPFSIKAFGAMIDMMDELTANDPEGRIKVADLKAGLANVKKNYEGKIEAMKRINFVEKEKESEKEFQAWVDEDEKRKEKYGHILKDIKGLYKKLAKTKDRDNVFGLLQGLASTPLNVAAQVYMIALEQEKPEGERNPNINKRAIERVFQQMQYTYANYYEPVDKAMMAYTLELAGELPEDQRITALDPILEQGAEEWVDQAYANSRIMDLEFAKGMFDMSIDELEALDDPFMDLMIKAYPLGEEIRKNTNEFASKVTDLRKQYIDALYEWKGENMYPDANSTMRFTYGNVKGYSPGDAMWYYPFTTLSGVIAKDKGAEPFDVPEGLKELYEEQDFDGYVDPDLQDIPVAFLHLGDITGGNSGSPVMNSKGEIIGVVFDGNYEAMISDWQYDYDLQRVISVDMRYVLFITEKFGKAGFILKEMGIK